MASRTGRHHACHRRSLTVGLEGGVPLKVMSERLGHSSLAVTADIYSHVRPEVDQAAADRVAELVLGAGNEKTPRR